MSSVRSRSKAAFVIVGASLLAGAVARAQAPTPNVSPDELRELEQALGADAAAQSPPPVPAATPAQNAASMTQTMPPVYQSFAPDTSLILDVALAAFSERDPLQTGAHDPNRNGFNLQQLELSLSKAVDPYFRMDSYIVFSQFGVEVEEAYATTLALPYNLQARAGQFLTRIGRLNPTHPHAWDFVDQPFQLGRVFGAEGNRGLGFELSWLAPLPWFVEVIASTTEAGGEATARSFWGPRDLGVYGPLDLQNTLVVKQFFELSADWSLMWGLSAAFGPNPTGYHTRTDLYATDLHLRWRPITYGSWSLVVWQTEVIHRRRQIPGDVLADVGGYSYVLWKFARRWATAARAEYGSPAWNQDGNVANDFLDPEWSGSRYRGSVNVTFWPTEFSRIRLQGSYDHPEWRDDPIFALFLAAQFVMGDHGAHGF